MKQIATFAGWSISQFDAHTDEDWYIANGFDYPRWLGRVYHYLAEPELLVIHT